MKKAIEIKYNFMKIDDAVHELHALKNRAIACSNMKYRMLESDGDAKTVLIDSYKAMTDCGASVANMIGNMIEYLNYAKSKMITEDYAMKKRISDHII